MIDPYLTGKEMVVLRMRLGLLGSEIHSLEEVSKKFGVTRERIRQLEEIAYNKIKKITVSRLREQNIKYY